MPTWSQYRVITAIPETDEWAEQELVSGEEWDHLHEAEAEMALPLPEGYPAATRRYIETRSYSDWEEVDV